MNRFDGVLSKISFGYRHGLRTTKKIKIKKITKNNTHKYYNNNSNRIHFRDGE